MAKVARVKSDVTVEMTDIFASLGIVKNDE